MKRLTFIFFMLFISRITFAAPPSWSVQEQQFSNTMTITGIVNISGVESSDSNDVVAAFVGAECRGVTHLLPSSTLGHAYAYLMIMSDTTGEPILFRIYNSKKDSIINIPDSCLFKTDQVLGTQENPYIFSDKTVNGISPFSFSLGVTGEKIVIDPVNDSIIVKVPFGTDITALTPFLISTVGAKAVISSTDITIDSKVNFTYPVTISIVSQNGKNSTNWTAVVHFLSPSSINDMKADVKNGSVIIQNDGILKFSDFPESAKCSVFSITGQCVVSSISIKEVVSLSNFAHAPYVVMISHNNENLLFSKKMVW